MMAIFKRALCLLALLQQDVRAGPTQQSEPQLGHEQMASLGTRAPQAPAFGMPQVETLKLLQFNMAGGTKNGGTHGIINRVVREVQERNPSVVSLNEICSGQYVYLLEQLETIGYKMEGHFRQARTSVAECSELSDPLSYAGNAILVRAPVLSTQGWVFTADQKLEQAGQPNGAEEGSVACVSSSWD